MQTRILAPLALAVMAACAGATRYTQWPYEAPMMLVRNPTANTLVVLARDGAGRELVAARIEPNRTQCFRWPFLHAIGYLAATEATTDTLTTQPFRPWSADGWEWSGEVEPRSNPNACR
ncbi:MAG TPA: hypothetical protein VKQ05_09950 [Gemmatimonadales bacterium]|nr:hypothetical protein [Gemmatimonadales bacterium]